MATLMIISLRKTTKVEVKSSAITSRLRAAVDASMGVEAAGAISGDMVSADIKNLPQLRAPSPSFCQYDERSRPQSTRRDRKFSNSPMWFRTLPERELIGTLPICRGNHVLLSECVSSAILGER